jgi:hypothetical protein
MSFISLGDGAGGFELAPGAVARALFGDRGMLNVVELAPGAKVPLHSHPHEARPPSQHWRFPPTGAGNLPTAVRRSG